MNMWQAVFFDFDGVILDSVGVKTEAFAELFRHYGPDIEKKVVEYHLANGGMSRYEKFRYYYREFLQRELSEAESELLGREFNALALRGVLEAPFIMGALESLEQVQQTGIPAFVVSGTPDVEIKYIIDKRGLAKYFKEVHGSPKGKVEIVRDILDRWKFEATKTLFIGDAMADLIAAKSNNANFLGIVSNETNSAIFPPDTTVSVGVTLDVASFYVT